MATGFYPGASLRERAPLAADWPHECVLGFRSSPAWTLRSIIENET